MNLESEIICSRQNRTVVETAKLTDRKAREQTKKFRFDGVKLFEEALKKGVEIETVLFRESGRDRIVKTVADACGESFLRQIGRAVTLSNEVFDKISEEKSPEGVICVAKYIDKFQKIVTIYNSAEISDMREERIVLLESVRDPANVGAIIRSAAAMGVDRLILSADCADIYHPRAVRASMGTLFAQRIDRTDSLPRVICALRESGRRVFAAALDPRAIRLGSFEADPSDCVVVGNEGHGLSEETVSACGQSVFIPMREGTESFNAAVAAAILMWEFAARERREGNS